MMCRGRIAMVAACALASAAVATGAERVDVPIRGKAVAVTITSAWRLFSRLTAFCTLLAPVA